MRNILLITNADMSLQSGNVVLVIRRAQSIYEQKKIKTNCIIIKKHYAKEINQNYEEIDFTYVKSRKFIDEYIVENRPSKIVLYGTSTYRLIPFVRKLLKHTMNNTELLIDLQGAVEETIEYSNGIQLIKRYPKYLLKRWCLKFAINNSDGAFVVSDEMMEYCRSFLRKKRKNEYTTYKCRCGITSIISSEQKILWRREVRKLWGIDVNTTVMVFSGYRMPWQKIDDIIELFKQYDEKMDKVVFAFYCNKDEEFIKKLEVAFPKGNYILEFLTFEKYFKYLCACDIGFLIRDYNVTNKVAFPNKFSDYINAGLIVAINKALPEPYSILKKHNIEFIDTEILDDKDMKIIVDRQNNILAFYKSTEKICENELLFSKQISEIKL